jgi:predicted dienelactone hydrolase
VKAPIVIALVLTCAGIAGAVVVRWSFELPQPTGQLPVGTLTLSLAREQDRPESPPGRFDVRVWYPAARSNDTAPYGSDGPGFKRWIYHRLVRTHAAQNADFAAVIGPAPVLVYVAAWGGEPTDNTALLEDLASHGYVVAALGDVAFDDPPLRHLSGPADFGSASAYAASLHLAHEKLRYAARRVSQLLDHLATLDAADPAGRFTHRLDLDRMAILGYSFGGAVAFEACRHDSRLRAAMNMDGWLFDSAIGYRGGIPYLLIGGSEPLPGPAELTAEDPVLRYESQLTLADDAIQTEVLGRGGYSLVVDGADHLSFSDVPLYAPLHRSGNGNADRISRAVRAVTVAFFERVFNGTPSPLLVPGENGDLTMRLNAWPFEPPGDVIRERPPE